MGRAMVGRAAGTSTVQRALQGSHSESDEGLVG